MIKAFEAIQWSFYQFRTRKVLSTVVIPCCIHSVILFCLILFMYEALGAYLFSFTPPELPSQLSWATGVLQVVMQVLVWVLLLGVILGTLAFGLSAATAIAHFFASPFNGWLSSAAESELRQVNHPELSLKITFLNGLTRELQRLKYWAIKAIFLGLLTLVCFWIPLINSIIGVIWSIFGAWMVGLQAVDYVADNNGYTFHQTLELCKKGRFNIIALGFCILGMMLVPGLNLLSMAISVLAGTFLWVKCLEKPEDYRKQQSSEMKAS